MYAVSGRSAATAATASHVAACLWNPSGSEAISVYRAEWMNSAATDGMRARVARASVRGTPGSTVTPDGDNSFDGRNPPASGPLLDLGTYSVQPTLSSAANLLAFMRSSPAAGLFAFWQPPVPITVPPGSGVAIATPTANAFAAADFTYYWDNGPSPFTGDAYYATGSYPGLGAGETVWGGLWNPSSPDTALHVFYVAFTHDVQTNTVDYGILLQRTTARGTQSSTGTINADCHIDDLTAPSSGVTIDQGYTVEPTLTGSALVRARMSERHSGAGLVWAVSSDDENGIDLNDCIVVPPGTGLAWVADSPANQAPKNVTWGWYE